MRPWSRFTELKDRLQALGYRLAEGMISASDFGVAQSRRRLFLVGDRAGIPKLVRSKNQGRDKPARSILDPTGTWKTSPLFLPRRAKATIERAERGMAALGGRTGFLLVYYSRDGGGGWQTLDRPLRTVTTIDRFALVEHDGVMWRMRMLQVPELRRAMGFDDGFALPIGTRRDRIRLLGNGVCPPVMEAVVRSLVADAN